MRFFFVLLIVLCSETLMAQGIVNSQTKNFDFKHIEAFIKIEPSSKTVEGEVLYNFDILAPADTLYIDARNMQFEDVLLAGDPVEFNSDSKRIYIYSDFQPGKNEILRLKYKVTPNSGIYFINWDYDEIDYSMKEVWTQGQGKYTSNWLPSFDDMNEKVEFDLNFEFPSFYHVISNGELIKTKNISDSTSVWSFDMDKPMSSYLIGMAAGNYVSKTIRSASGIDIQLYYKPEDSLMFEPTYRYSKEIFNFLEDEIGVSYPWQNYKQIPVLDFLYGGMENTGTTIFSSSYVTDSIGFNDRNYVNVNAHELAHQWFGNLVTETNGEHHWLHEGFATYYALLAEREVFGEDYYYWKLFQTAEALKELSDSGKGGSLLDPKASSMTFYQKGAWALHILRETVGDEAFKKGVKNYLELYAYKNVTIDNFLSELESESRQDLSQFKKDWLEQSAFKATQSLESLKKSEFITSYLNIASLRETVLDSKKEYLEKALEFPVNDYTGQEAVNQLSGLSSENAIKLYRKAFQTNNIFVRQAIARTMEKIPASLKSEFESLLEDESYVTIEAALFKLWEQFPKDRGRYLEQTRDLDGFYNKNIRMLWLTLNLVTPEFEPELTENYYDELTNYTQRWQPFQIRENAFGYLYQIGAFSPESLESLIHGTQHHTYSFRNYCRALVNELLKNEEYSEQLTEISADMDEEITSYLRSKING